jgi:hypothetical protein
VTQPQIAAHGIEKHHSERLADAPFRMGLSDWPRSASSPIAAAAAKGQVSWADQQGVQVEFIRPDRPVKHLYRIF